MAELILALDVPRGTDALRLLDQLPELRWVKVGPILMTREGPGFVRALTGRGLKVFLDLKWHDIPNTVAGAVTAAREIGAAMATVHTLGGRAMLEAAAVAAGTELALVGVTVLTSHEPAGYARALGRPEVDIPREVERQGLAAAEAGLRGVVCSPQEVATLRRRLGPDLYIVVPGIRRRSDPTSDQARVATARMPSPTGRPILSSAVPCSRQRIRRWPTRNSWRRPVASVPDGSGVPRAAGDRVDSGHRSPASRGPGSPSLVCPRPAGLVANSPRLLIQLPGADPSVALGPAQAATLLADFVASAEEVETLVRAAREVEPGRGYVELQRRYRVTGTQNVRVQVLLLGYRLERSLEPDRVPRHQLVPCVCAQEAVGDDDRRGQPPAWWVCHGRVEVPRRALDHRVRLAHHRSGLSLASPLRGLYIG